MKIIPIVFCFDANYAQYAAVATYSLKMHTQADLRIYWIIPGEAKQKTSLLQNHLKKYNIEVSLVIANTDHFNDWKEGGYITRGAYLRLLIPTLIDEERVIYLDCDLIVISNIASLYELEMNGCPIGGIIDHGGSTTSKIPRDKNDTYINSGVLVMNLEWLRKDDFLEKCKTLYRAHIETITWHDQCIINKYAENKKYIIDPKWNRQVFINNLNLTNWQQLLANKNSSIIHFVGPVKPWHEYSYPPLSEFWWQYARKIELSDLSPMKITNVNHAISLADAYDLNMEFKKASNIKSQIINSLLLTINQSR